ncbi:MAG: amino acid ABC transporter substrate-binding protein [Hyphomicrobiaceae bacterium]|nr:amino acid ABC transporter substrate-binding protein [Hyphomicrobiaceae bacterium]
MAKTASLVLGLALGSMLVTASVAQEKITFGASLPMTGGLAINGQKHKEGYELCADLVNASGGLLGKQVEILVSDNQSSNETGQAQIERLINENKVDALLGTFSSRITFAQTSVAEQNKMVYPIPSGVALQIYERGYNYIFNFQPSAAEYLGQSYASMIADLVDPAQVPPTAAVVYADDFYANAAVAGLLGQSRTIAGTDTVIDLSPGALADAGVETVFEQQWPEEGFSDWITLANSIKNSGAEFFVGFTASPDEAIQLIRALKTVNYQPKVAIMGQGTQTEYHDQLGSLADGTMIHAAWHPAVGWVGTLGGKDFSNQDFISAFEAKFNKEPDEDNAIPFATCQGMVQAIAAVGTTDNTQIRDWLAARTADDPVRTILGDFHWDAKGLPEGKSFLITQWQNGELKFVYPVGEFPGTSDLIWPKPAW